MPSRDDAARPPASDEELLENIGTAFSRLRRRTSSVPIDPPVARSDVRRDLLLAIVEESDGLLSVNAVAAALGMERTAVSRLAASCVTEGLVERVASQTDGRSITLRLTPHGPRGARGLPASATPGIRIHHQGLGRRRTVGVRPAAPQVRRRLEPRSIRVEARRAPARHSGNSRNPADRSPRWPSETTVNAQGVPSTRDSMAFTELWNAFTRALLPMLPSTTARIRPRRFLPSRMTT